MFAKHDSNQLPPGDRGSLPATILKHFLARRWLVGLTVLVVLLLAANALVVSLMRVYIENRRVTFSDSALQPGNEEPPGSDSPGLSGDSTLKAAAPDQPIANPVLGRVSPFQEVEAFDDDALHWSNIFSGYSAGILIFDANGDSRLDVYFLQDGQNWTRPTDQDGVLMDQPRGRHSVLYINQGNDAQGRPLFVQAAKLSRNREHVQEELLLENFLYPRQSSADSLLRPGRIADVAVAADFNGDGRTDVLVGSALPGMIFSHPKTQVYMPELVHPVGRESRRSKLPLTAQGLYLIQYQPRDNRNDRQASSRGEESMGANSLFLNMGDQDGDGLPEWRDASREAGIEGRRNTISLSVADVDLDGDLDIYAGNVMDADYWPGGSRQWAGAANELYINQLAQTGELRFLKRGAQMNVDGLFDADHPMPTFHKLYKIPFLPEEYSFLWMKFVPYMPELLEIGGIESEPAEISWAAAFQDVNLDGYPDIWVANDMTSLRLHINQQGKGFKLGRHSRWDTSGNWMSLAFADFDGDLKEDIFAGNLGGGVMNIATAVPDPQALFEPVIAEASGVQHYYGGHHNFYHAILDGSDPEKEFEVRVRHSRILPPDASLPGNIRQFSPFGGAVRPLRPDSLHPYEFSWGSTVFDVQNDGRMDYYYLGCLYGRGGGLYPIMGVGPGRLFINGTQAPSELYFEDLTAEYHVLNIEELQYDKLESEGYIYRRSPAQNWGKRDMLYSYDRSTWSLHGPLVQEHVTNHDMIQASENGRAVMAADLNGDGFSDLLVRNVGGYDSRRSDAVNLKVRIDGQARVLPAHSYFYPTPTNFDPGSTRLFLNTHRENNWIRVRLIDDSQGALNRDAIGARVTVNGKLLVVKRSGEGGYAGNRLVDPLFGLARDLARSIEVVWPDREQTTGRWDLPDLANGTVTISKNGGYLGFTAAKN